jgi:acyl carrier protein
MPSVMKIISAISGQEDIQPEMTLSDLDIDAIDLAYLAMNIEDELNITISHDTMTSWQTVSDILEVI